MKLLKISTNSHYLNKIEEIYNYSFPENERINFEDMVNCKFSNSKLYAILKSNRLIGFTYITLCNNFAYIVYFAIDKSQRNKGLGTLSINKICNFYKNKTKVLCVEKPTTEDPTKLRRIKFYERNGFLLANFQFNYLEQDYFTMYKGPLNKQEFIECLNACFPGCKDFKNI